MASNGKVRRSGTDETADTETPPALPLAPSRHHTSSTEPAAKMPRLSDDRYGNSPTFELNMMVFSLPLSLHIDIIQHAQGEPRRWFGASDC